MGLLWVDTSLWDCIATYTTRLITTMTLYSHNTYGASKLSGAKPSSKSNVKNDTNIFNTILVMCVCWTSESVGRNGFVPRWYSEYCSLSMNGFRSRPRRPVVHWNLQSVIQSPAIPFKNQWLQWVDSYRDKIIVGQKTNYLDTGILKMLEATNITWWNICFRTGLSSNRVLRV